MIKVNIISVGNLKEKYLIDGIKEYIKRISKYATVLETIVLDESICDNPSNKQIEEIKVREADKILKKIDLKSFKIILDLRGKMLSSVELATKFTEVATYHNSAITFVIGGSLGLAEKIIEIGDLNLCFSKMTFPHQLMKLILVEQIYRAFKINNNETYHK